MIGPIQLGTGFLNACDEIVTKTLRINNRSRKWCPQNWVQHTRKHVSRVRNNNYVLHNLLEHFIVIGEKFSWPQWLVPPYRVLKRNHLVRQFIAVLLFYLRLSAECFWWIPMFWFSRSRDFISDLWFSALNLLVLEDTQLAFSCRYHTYRKYLI